MTADVTSYGAAGDVIQGTATSAVTGTVVASAAVFSSGDVGKAIMIEEAATGGLPAYRKIVGYVDPYTVQITPGVDVGVANVSMRFGTDDTDAFRAAAAALQSNGGGTLLIPSGSYWLMSTVRDSSPVISDAVVEFTSISGITISAQGATVYADRPYANGVYLDLFRFTDCSDVTVEGFVGRGYEYTGVDLHRGAKLVVLKGACSNVDVTADLRGYGSGVEASAALSDRHDPAHHSSGIVVDLNLVACGYGLSCQFSGSDVSGSVVADRCWRAYITYGASNHILAIDATNQFGGSVITNWIDSRSENLQIQFTSKGSTLPLQGVPILEIGAAGTASGAATLLKDVHLDFDVEFASGSTQGAVVRFAKYWNNGTSTTPDTSTREHVIDGLSISGSISGKGNKEIFEWYDTTPGDYGDWSVETFLNWQFRDLTLTNTGPIELDLRALEDAVMQNIQTSSSFVAVVPGGNTLTLGTV